MQPNLRKQFYGIYAALLKKVLVTAIVCTCMFQQLQSQIISTIAGTGAAGYSGDNGLANAAGIAYPRGITTDAAGNVYIADYNNHCVRKITVSTGIITTIAGTGTSGYSGDNGLATAALLKNPSDIAIDASGNIYITDYNSHCVRKITVSTGIITTIAGTGTSGFSGDGGLATAAKLSYPGGVVIDGSGNLYIADMYNYCIRKITASTGKISTIAGTGGVSGNTGDGGAAISAKLNYPYGVALDALGNVYIADGSNNCIRKVDITTGNISTVAGTNTATGSYAGDGGLATAAGLSGPTSVKFDAAGDMYIADEVNGCIRKVVVSTGIITTIVGTGGVHSYTGDGGLASSATLGYPWSVAFDASGNMYISDYNKSVIRKVAPAAPTPPGNAVILDGVNDYISIPDNAALKPATVTLEAWVKAANNTSLLPVICKVNSRGATFSNESYSIYQINGQFAAAISSAAGVQNIAWETGSFVVGKWYHVAATFSSTQVSFYVNGVLQQTVATGYPIDYAATPVVIGAWGNLAGFLNIAVDEVRIWNTDRSSSITADMNNVVSASATGLVAYYNFDEGVAGGTNTGITTVTDATSNALNGTLYNSALTGSTSNWVESYAMAIPTATTANSITATGFTANWTAPIAGTVSNYILDVSTTPDFSAPVTGSPFTVSGSSTSKAITGLTQGTTCYYRVAADKTSVTGQGGYSNSITAVPGISTWTGTTSSDYNTATNWSPNGVPASGFDLTIPNVTPAPIISNSTTASVNNLTINTNASLTVNGKLTITGTGTNNGTLTVAPGAALINSNAISNVVLQQNIIAQRGWRMFANPFTTTQTFASLSTANNVTIQTTGSANVAGIADTRTWSNSGNVWADAGTGTTANTAYGLFIRGIKSDIQGGGTGLIYAAGPTAFTYGVSGTLNSGDYTVAAPNNTGNFSIVGNPFAAPVNSIELTGGTAQSYYTYQIAVTGNGQTRAGSWQPVVSSSATTPIPVLGVIAWKPSTAYTIHATGINTANAAATGLFGVEPIASFLELSVEKAGVYQDKLFVRLDAAATANGTDKIDLEKFYNDNVNVYSITDNASTRLAIDARNVLSTIPLGISALAGDYNFKLSNNSLPEGTTVTLTDKLLNTNTALKVGDVYPFSITTDAASHGEQRFALSFSAKTTAAVTDPATSLTATVLGNVTSANQIAVQIAGAAAPVTIAVKDMNGKAIKTINAVNGIQYVNVGNTAAGMLILQISDGKNSVTKKVIKL